MDMDTAMAEDEMLKDELAGSTAVVVVIKDDVIYCVSKTNILFNLCIILVLHFFLSNFRLMLEIQELLHQSVVL